MAKSACNDSAHLSGDSKIPEGGDLWAHEPVRRAAASIGANIAEGCGRRSDGDMCRFLQIVRGSASEAEYHFLLARDLHFLDDKEFQMLSHEADELQRMLTALMQRIGTVKSAQT